MNHIEYLEYSLGGELYHHGVKGMKWGVRRARNKHYRSFDKSERLSNKWRKAEAKYDDARLDGASSKWTVDRYRKRLDKLSSKSEAAHNKAMQDQHDYNRRAEELHKRLSESVKNDTFGKSNPSKAKAVAKTLLKVAPLAIGAATLATGTGPLLARITAGIASANAATTFTKSAESAWDSLQVKEIEVKPVEVKEIEFKPKRYEPIKVPKR